MDVSDDDLRALVQATIARVLGTNAPAQQMAHQDELPTSAGAFRSAVPLESARTGDPRPAAFALLALPRGGDQDGACLIEPAVRCTHCGYCLSLGH
jgi:hypothetical protein